jgi:hypothetical protein
MTADKQRRLAQAGACMAKQAVGRDKRALELQFGSVSYGFS